MSSTQFFLPSAITQNPLTLAEPNTIIPLQNNRTNHKQDWFYEQHLIATSTTVALSPSHKLNAVIEIIAKNTTTKENQSQSLNDFSVFNITNSDKWFGNYCFTCAPQHKHCIAIKLSLLLRQCATMLLLLDSTDKYAALSRHPSNGVHK